MVMKLDQNNLHVRSPFRSPRIIEDERRCSQRSEGRPRSCSESKIQSFAMTWAQFFCRLGGWGWLQDRGWARARSLLRRPKRKEKRWDAHFLPLLPWGNGERFASLVSHLAHIAWSCILHNLFGVFQAFPSFCLQFKMNFRFSQLKITGRKG